MFQQLGVLAAGVLMSLCVAAEPEAPAPHTVDDLDWMVGRWVGTGLGAEVEEVFMPARAGTMPCAFRVYKGDRPGFYEFMLYENTAEGVQISMHHFSPGLRRWEDTPVVFDLQSIDGTTALFAERDDEVEHTRLKYVREGDTMRAELIDLVDGEDKVTAAFDYTLADDPS